MDETPAVMRIGVPDDPALEAATGALHGQAHRHASRFASIELRAADSARSHLAPFGYGIAILAALAVAITAWNL